MSRYGRPIHLSVVATMALLIAGPSPAAESAKEKPGLFAWLSKKEQKEEPADPINQWRKQATLTDQLQGTRNRIAELKQRLKSVDDDDEEDDIEDTLEILEFVEKWASDTLESDPSDATITSVNVQISRILAGVDDPVQGEDFPAVSKLFGNVVLGRVFGHSIPNLSPERQEQPLGLTKAQAEARFLYDPADRSFVTAEEMAGMTPEEVSRLDVSPHHPAWYRVEDFARIRNGRLKDFDQSLEDGMTLVLRDDDDLGKHETYGMDEARKVLFIKDIYLSATSPKGTVEDAFGVDWKLKWGDESNVEPVSSRLYLLTGAKITDGNFVNGFGPAAMTLVLAEPGEYKAGDDKPEQGDERTPETVEQLRQTLFDFYKFDVTPYIHSHGTITASNVNSILRNLPGNGKKKYRKEKLIGRQWIAFRESMVELKPKGLIRRFDGCRMSDPAAIDDRSARGNFLFNLWVTTRDAKDDNYKAYFVKAPAGKKKKLEIRSYKEGQHDIGYSLSSLWSAGDVNKMKTGDAFARRGLFGAKFRFPVALIFKPESWDASTWADAKWMARKITGMTEDEIREAVAYSEWPDFMQEAFVYKLIERRNRIGEFFDLTDQLDRYPAVPPDMSVPLGSDREIRSAERKYGLAAGSLQNELATLGTGPGYREAILSKGQVASWKNSALVRLLVRQRYPSGLDDRYNRMLDKYPAAIEAE